MINKLQGILLGILISLICFGAVKAQQATDSVVINASDHFQLSADTSVLSGVTNFLGGGSLTTLESGILLDRPCVVTGLTINTSSAPGLSLTDTYTLRKNGVNTAITGTITGTNKTLMITGQSIAFNSGDILSVQVQTALLSGTSNIHALIPYQ